MRTHHEQENAMGLLKHAVLYAVIGAAAHAQAADPLSGKWSGYIGQSEASPSEIHLELRLAANGAVTGVASGPMLNPGDITAGSFNRATGALKFSVVIRGDTRGGNVQFDGKVVHDTASGKLTMGNETGVFRLTRGDGSRAPAPAKANGDAGAAMRRSFVEVADWLTRGAELVPADKYSYRPVATVRTLGQLVGHVIDGMKFYCARGAQKNVQWADAAEKGTVTKAGLTPLLKSTIAECMKVYDAGGQSGPLVDGVGHASLHYGNLVTYIRMLGLVPPSS
jgi:hypothetical protein